MDDADRAAARDGFPDPHVALAAGAQPPRGDLKSALRRARVENAERFDVISELRGAEVVLSGVRMVEVELSVVALYEGQPMMFEVMQYLDSNGFELCTVIHLVRPWGEPVHDLDQLRAAVDRAPADVLFQHTVQVQLRDPTAIELPSDDLSAWVAVVVQEDYRKHGIATYLLRRLAKIASEQGIVGFTADVLPENSAMLNSFKKIAAPLETWKFPPANR